MLLPRLFHPPPDSKEPCILLGFSPNQNAVLAEDDVRETTFYPVFTGFRSRLLILTSFITTRLTFGATFAKECSDFLEMRFLCEKTFRITKNLSDDTLPEKFTPRFLASLEKIYQDYLFYGFQRCQVLSQYSHKITFDWKCHCFRACVIWQS